MTHRLTLCRTLMLVLIVAAVCVMGIGAAEASINWIKYDGSPVLELGASGEWDDGHVEYPMVIKTDSLYEMWYTGGHVGPYAGNNKIGYASSNDGIIWTKYSGNPVLSTGSGWESYYVFSPSVIKDEGIYKMWYSGYAGGTLTQIGYATSIDGKSWTKHGSPVLSIGSSWDSRYVENPTVIKDGSIYKMWYVGNDGSGGSIGYATSTDGINWIKYSGNPVMGEVVYRPKVIKDDSVYRMYYRGNADIYGNYRACSATSTDGITWTKSNDNPILELGPSDTWDDYGTDNPMVIKDGTTYKMWYTGYDGLINGNTMGRIGYATFTDSEYTDIEVTENSGSELIDYQILIELDSSNFDFSRAQPDGSDIRFKELDNTLNHWIEEWDSTGESAKIWIKVPFIPASGTTTIKMYYGNPNAVSSSNGSAVFEFFDDFEDGIWTDKWNLKFGTNTVEESNGILTIHYDGNMYHNTGIQSYQDFTGQPAIIEWKAKRDYAYGITTSLHSQSTDNQIAAWDYDYCGWGLYLRKQGCNFGDTYSSAGGITDLWKVYRMIINDTEVTLKRGDDFDNLDEQTGLTLDSTFNAFSYDVTLNQERSLGQWDFIWVRKYAPIEPTEVINKPPVANASGPYTGSEYQPIIFNGSASYDPDADDSIVNYEWDFDNDGITDATGMEASWIWNDDYTGVVSLTVTDSHSENNTDSTSVTVLNAPPVVDAGADQNVNEGDSVSFSGSFTDSGADDTHTIEWDFGDGNSGIGLIDPAHIYADNGIYTVTCTITDDDGASSSDTLTVIVNNVAPTINSITSLMDPVQIGTGITASVAFNDYGTGDTHNAVWNWGDGFTSSGTITENGGSGDVTGNHVYVTPGIYTISLRVTDDDGGVETIDSSSYIVIYDPEGGFVTGGGWINSPEGAYAPDPILTGKANFGFISKYKIGVNAPTGQTEFQFKVANFNFHSTSYDWLVIAGAQAKFKGNGTINGEGNLGFMLTGIDGGVPGGGGVDKFRIKIWDKNNGDMVIYDNQPDETDDSDLTTEIKGGSITIHSGK